MMANDSGEASDTRVALIPARRGSKGLADKNLKPFDGEPLWRRAVHQGILCASRSVLSTDIPGIDRRHMPSNSTLLRRPAELAADDTPMADVVSHAIANLQLTDETIILLQPTSPLRHDADIEAALDLHQSGPFDLVLSVSETDRAILKYGTLSDAGFTAVADPAYCFANRQDLPPVYRPNGAVYVFGADAFQRAQGFPTTRIGAHLMPPERSVDIDDPETFRAAEKLWSAARLK